MCKSYLMIPAYFLRMSYSSMILSSLVFSLSCLFSPKMVCLDLLHTYQWPLFLSVCCLMVIGYVQQKIIFGEVPKKSGLLYTCHHNITHLLSPIAFTPYLSHPLDSPPPPLNTLPSTTYPFVRNGDEER